jgi:hypothetical protein
MRLATYEYAGSTQAGVVVGELVHPLRHGATVMGAVSRGLDGLPALAAD